MCFSQLKKINVVKLIFLDCRTMVEAIPMPSYVLVMAPETLHIFEPGPCTMGNFLITRITKYSDFPGYLTEKVILDFI